MPDYSSSSAVHHDDEDTSENEISSRFSQLKCYAPPSTPQARPPTNGRPSSRRPMLVPLLSPQQKCVAKFNEDILHRMDGIASPDREVDCHEYKLNNFFGDSCESFSCSGSGKTSTEESPSSSTRSNTSSDFAGISIDSTSSEDSSDYSSCRSVVTSLQSNDHVNGRRSKFSQRHGLPPRCEMSSVSYDDGELVCECL